MSGSRFVFIVSNMMLHQLFYTFIVVGNIMQCLMTRRYLFQGGKLYSKLQVRIGNSLVSSRLV